MLAVSCPPKETIIPKWRGWKQSSWEHQPHILGWNTNICFLTGWGEMRTLLINDILPPIQINIAGYHGLFLLTLWKPYTSMWTMNIHDERCQFNDLSMLGLRHGYPKMVGRMVYRSIGRPAGCLTRFNYNDWSESVVMADLENSFYLVGSG